MSTNAKLEKGLAKKAKKKLAKGGGTAEAALQFYGADALAALDMGPDSSQLALRDIQNVLLWVLTPDAGEMPKWVCVRNKPLIRGALLCFVPGMDLAAQQRMYAATPV